MDLTSQVVEAINAWLQSAAGQVVGPALAMVGRLLFSTPAFDTMGEISTAWSLVRGIADALFAIAMLVVGIAVMGRGGNDIRYSAKILIPRLVLAAVLANTSLVICGALIQLNNGIVVALFGGDQGTAIFDGVVKTFTGGLASANLLGVLVGLGAAVMSVLLVVLYVARDLGLVLAIVVAPLALACAAMPPTEELARLWMRVFGAPLFVQVVEAVLVVVGVQLLHRVDWLGAPGADLSAGLVLVTLLYILLQLPLIACRWSFQQRVSLGAPTRTIISAARGAMAA